MSIYIKGMKMPERGCNECFLRHGNLCSQLPKVTAEKIISYAKRDRRHPHCPIRNVPMPHGPLRDSLMITKNVRYFDTGEGRLPYVLLKDIMEADIVIGMDD